MSHWPKSNGLISVVFNDPASVHSTSTVDINERGGNGGGMERSTMFTWNMEVVVQCVRACVCARCDLMESIKVGCVWAVAADLLAQLESIILNSAEQEKHFCGRSHLLLKPPDQRLAFRWLSVSSYTRVSPNANVACFTSAPDAWWCHPQPPSACSPL